MGWAVRTDLGAWEPLQRAGLLWKCELPWEAGPRIPRPVLLSGLVSTRTRSLLRWRQRPRAAHV